MALLTRFRKREKIYKQEVFRSKLQVNTPEMSLTLFVKLSSNYSGRPIEEKWRIVRILELKQVLFKNGTGKNHNFYQIHPIRSARYVS